GFYESIAGSDKPDELGALNLLTPKRILRGSKEEIQQGRVVSLNWPLQLPIIAGYGRKNFSHRAFKKPDRYVIDDEVFMK
ncbi:MAG TPA: hypothetical protein VGO47_00730, partial [Chlamydiales bacterium]|nr:hypothetical protein [Chlamydiales bacterium]